MSRRYPLLIIALFSLLNAATAQVTDTENIAITLEFAEQRLLSSNPDIAMSHAAVSGAEAGIQSAKAGPNPVLGFSTSGIDPHAGVGGGHVGDKRIDSILTLSQVFERGDKRKLRSAVATANFTAARGDLADTLRLQRIAVAGAFYDLLAAQQHSSLAMENARFARRSASIAATRLAAGDLARVDLARARTDAARAEAEADQALGDQRQAQSLLAELLDMGRQATKLHAVGNWPVSAEGNTSNASGLDIMLARRTDVTAARARVESARVTCDLARSQRSRDITVGVQVEHNPQNPQFTHSPLYGFSVSVPLLFGNDYQGDIAKAEADYTAALEALRKVENAARAELANRRIALDIFGRHVHRFNDVLLPEARRAATAAEFAFEHGAIGIGDLLDARRTLNAAEQDAVTAQKDYATALYAWQIENFHNDNLAVQEKQK